MEESISIEAYPSYNGLWNQYHGKIDVSVNGQFLFSKTSSHCYIDAVLAQEIADGMKEQYIRDWRFFKSVSPII